MSGKAERANKRVRRLSTDSEGSSDGYEWVDRRAQGQGQAGRAERAVSSNESRSRRTVQDNLATATVSRGQRNPASLSPESMRLTVKTSSSKLRDATRSSSSGGASSNSRDQFQGGEIIEGKRARNVRKSYVMESDSEEEDDDEDEEMEDVGDDDEDDEDAEGELFEEDDDLDDGLGDEDEDADADADGDIDMDVPPPPPIIKVSKARSGKQTIVAKQLPDADTVTVEQREVELGSDDEELSELDSDVGEEAAEEEAMQTGNEEDMEEEDEEIEVEAEDDEEDEIDSDGETPGGGSRASTPDINKLTKRQRARLEDGGSGHLMALPDEVQVKKHLTAEEHAMRRAEMARRRKNLSEKRNEEEKMDTINKLLKKQAPKTNARRNNFNPTGGDTTPDSETQKANPLFVRWVSNKDGNRIGVPEEWLESPVGSIFQGGVKQPNSGIGGKLIQEVS